jgi:hypothetical protein
MPQRIIAAAPAAPAAGGRFETWRRDGKGANGLFAVELLLFRSGRPAPPAAAQRYRRRCIRRLLLRTDNLGMRCCSAAVALL